MAETNTDETAESEKLQQKNAYSEAILENYDDPEERRLAAKQLDDAFGLGLAEDFSNQTKDALEDSLKNQQEKVEAKDDEGEESEEVVEEEEAVEAKAEETEEAVEEVEEEDTEAKADDSNSEVAELKKMLEEMKAQQMRSDEKIIELEAKTTLDSDEQKIRDEVSKAMSNVVEKNKSEDVRFQEQVDKHKEEYGEEAAKVLSERIGDFQKERDDNLKRRMEDEYEKRKAARESEINEGATLQKAVFSNSDLKQWYEDCMNNPNDQAKQRNYRLAQLEDQALLLDPEWASRPMEERFGEAVNRVKVRLGQAEPGSPNTSKQAGKAGSAKAAADRILQEARKKTKPMPSTLTDIPGETVADNKLSMESLERMDPITLLDSINKGRMTIDSLDQFMSQNAEYVN